jgi:hypothetical protein
MSALSANYYRIPSAPGTAYVTRAFRGRRSLVKRRRFDFADLLVQPRNEPIGDLAAKGQISSPKSIGSTIGCFTNDVILVDTMLLGLCRLQESYGFVIKHNALPICVELVVEQDAAITVERLPR